MSAARRARSIYASLTTYRLTLRIGTPYYVSKQGEVSFAGPGFPTPPESVQADRYYTHLVR